MRKPLHDVLVVVMAALSVGLLTVSGCGGSGGGRVHPAPTAEELTTELNTRTDSADLKTTYTDLFWVVGAGSSTVSSPLHGLPADDDFADLLAQLQSRVNAGFTDPLVTMATLREHMTWVSDDLPTFLARLNAWTSTHWDDASIGTHNITRLIACSSLPYPSTPPTLTSDTRVQPYQMHMILMWSLIQYPERSVLACEAELEQAQNRQRYLDFYSSWPGSWFVSADTLARIRQNTATAWKVYTDCMHEQ